MSILSGFAAFIVRGGPAMIGLLLCSVLVIAVIVERLLYLLQQRTDSELLLTQVTNRVRADDVGGAVAICNQNRGMLPAIFKAGLEHADESRADIDDALALALSKNTRKLDRNLGIIGTIAVIAPFVGLFGTVLGIIHAFDDIALKGNSSPAVVAAGVGEALVTTAAGLFVAVTAVIFFNYFKTAGRSFRDELTDDTAALAAILHSRQFKRAASDGHRAQDGSGVLAN